MNKFTAFDYLKWVVFFISLGGLALYGAFAANGWFSITWLLVFALATIGVVVGAFGMGMVSGFALAEKEFDDEFSSGFVEDSSRPDVVDIAFEEVASFDEAVVFESEEDGVLSGYQEMFGDVCEFGSRAPRTCHCDLPNGVCICSPEDESVTVHWLN